MRNHQTATSTASRHAARTRFFFMRFLVFGSREQGSADGEFQGNDQAGEVFLEFLDFELLCEEGLAGAESDNDIHAAVAEGLVKTVREAFQGSDGLGCGIEALLGEMEVLQ